MRQSFQALADKFSGLDPNDLEGFISFFESSKQEIGMLENFETDEELYLAIVIHHTYGRSQLFELKDFAKAERHLSIAKDLILANKERFEIDLTDDIWYQQTLQHLLTVFLNTARNNRAIETIADLKELDPKNQQYYNLELKELDRVLKYKVLMAVMYTGSGILVLSIGYRFITGEPLWYTNPIGILLTVIGWIGSSLLRTPVKGRVPDSWPGPDEGR